MFILDRYLIMVHLIKNYFSIYGTYNTTSIKQRNAEAKPCNNL